MKDADLIPLFLMRQIKELEKAGFRVTVESSKEGLLTLKISKNETD